MFTVLGRAALSPSRRARSFAKLQAIAPGLAMLDTRWAHLVVMSREPTPDEQRQLTHMLTYGPEVADMTPSGAMISAPATVAAAATTTFWIAPRIGTTSPWSSKATDIAHVCGLEAVVRIERVLAYTATGVALVPATLGAALADRMTETVIVDPAHLERVVASAGEPRPLATVALGSDPARVLREASTRLGLALADDEIGYLARRYGELRRDPTDVELMMFAQANSEHCRHKIFNASWHVDGAPQVQSLFELIKASTAASPTGVRSA
ncbi:MAG: hypothetical protein NT062_19700 [Proteobacteria bacterium]|nr:hypothetical protein [Pseudomonadota bacterium]